jgi:hypothetical protein
VAVSLKEQEAAAQLAAEKQKEVNRIVGLVNQTSEVYRKERMDEDLAALAFYRGRHWQGDGTVGGDMGKYRAQQNEVFPAIDTIVSSLALGVPAVEPVDDRYWSDDAPLREDDLTISGRRVGAVLNSWAHADRLDYTTQEAVLHACVFGIGIIKTTWSPKLGRPIVRTKLPWEWFCDPGAQRIEEATWAYEYFPLHIGTLRERVNNGQYAPIKEAINPDSYPKGLISDKDMDDDERKARAAGLREYVNMVEFFDYKNKRLYHIHPSTKQVLLDVPLPWGRTYDVLVFHDAVGRIRGVSDVELMASNQRDINMLFSAQREMVFRLPKRMLVDRDIFEDQDEFEAFKNSKSWEPTPIKMPNGSTFNEKVYVTPEMGTTYDFQRHFEALKDGARSVLGEGDYQGGRAVNIRTAKEASMLEGSTQGRMNIRMSKLTRVIGDVFQRMLTTWKWAVENEDASGVDMEQIAADTQGDTAADQLLKDLVENTPKFKLLPFSPMMEDKFARRQELANFVNSLAGNPALAAAFDMRELAREFVELHGFRPSVLLSQEAVQAASQNAALAQTPDAAPLAAQAGPDMPQMPIDVPAPPAEPAPSPAFTGP